MLKMTSGASQLYTQFSLVLVATAFFLPNSHLELGKQSIHCSILIIHKVGFQSLAIHRLLILDLLTKEVLQNYDGFREVVFAFDGAKICGFYYFLFAIQILNGMNFRLHV